MGALPIDTAAFVGDAQPTGPDSGGEGAAAPAVTEGGAGAAPTAAARARG